MTELISPSKAGRLWHRVIHLEAPLAVATILMVVVFAVGYLILPEFATGYSINANLVLAAFLGVAAAGQTLVVLLGGIDLSVPYFIGMGDVVVSELYQRGMPFFGAVAVTIFVAMCIGATSGLLSAALRLPPLIVTLGVGFVVYGAYQFWTGGKASGAAPAWLTRIVAPGSSTGFLPVAPIVLVWLGIIVIIVVGLRRTIFGRQMYAVGSSRRAAELSLIRPVKVWTVVFALSAGLSVVAGVLLLGFTGSAFANVGDPYLFLSVGAVVVGGTSLLGGRGGYAATAVGAVLLTELATILVGSGLSQAVEQVVLGVVIIVMVSVYGRERHVRMRI